MNYDKYELSKLEWLEAIAVYALLAGLVAFFFYRSGKVFGVLCVGFPIYLRYLMSKKKDKRKKRLLDEFSETLSSVCVNLRSGYSLENAFLESYKDIVMFYGRKSLMASEIQKIRKGLEVNITLEELIEDLANRSKEKEILLLSEVIKSAKRNGGNITEVLSNTAERIRSGVIVDKEIDTILSEKKLELKIMESVPFILMVYLEVTSVGYFDSLYVGIRGRVFMTVCLLIYMVAVIIGKKLIKIEV